MAHSFLAYYPPRKSHPLIFFRYVSLNGRCQKMRAQEPQIHSGAGFVIDGYGQNSVNNAGRIGPLVLAGSAAALLSRITPHWDFFEQSGTILVCIYPLHLNKPKTIILPLAPHSPVFRVPGTEQSSFRRIRPSHRVQQVPDYRP